MMLTAILITIDELSLVLVCNFNPEALKSCFLSLVKIGSDPHPLEYIYWCAHDADEHKHDGAVIRCKNHANTFVMRVMKEGWARGSCSVAELSYFLHSPSTASIQRSNHVIFMITDTTGCSLSSGRRPYS